MPVDPDELVRRVQADLEAGLAHVIAPVENGFQFADIPEAVLRGEVVGAVAWTWRGLHRGSIAGVAPTHKEVVVEGVTIVDVKAAAAEQPAFRRYVDWLGVLTQIGAVFTGRAVNAAPLPAEELQQ